MERKRSNAFITARKGFCYLTIKFLGRNHEMMRIRKYRIEADEKRHMRQLCPDVAFDWKKITQQLAEKREACRLYRSRRRNPDTAGHPRGREPLFYGAYAPGTRTVYVNDVPSSAAGMGALLDAVLQIDRGLTDAFLPPEPTRGRTKPRLELVKNSVHPKPRHHRESDDF
jgi:hypothetical protein